MSRRSRTASGRRFQQLAAQQFDRGVQREFLGFNRACHAVLEASILVSRVRMLDRAEIAAELDRLQLLVDKTGGPREREAMAYVIKALARACECE